MDSINPKYIFQGLMLLVGLVLFCATILYQRIRTGKDVRAIILEKKSTINNYFLVALLLLVASFIALAIANNIRH